MDDNGYIYVLINPSMQNLVKIGKTKRTPEERAKELSSTTGVPVPFIVAYSDFFQNHSKAEKHIHTILETKGYRVSTSREFFEIPIKDAIDAILETKQYFITNVYDENKDNLKFDNEEVADNHIEPWYDMYDIAIGYQYGEGEYIQDYNDAITYYLKAIKLGYKEGYDDLGYIYEVDLENTKKALAYYKTGIKDGCIDCYASLGSMLSMEFDADIKNLTNALKSYELYMKKKPDTELSYAHIASYLKLSIIDIILNGEKQNIEYFSKTIPYKEEVLKWFKEHVLRINYTCTYKTFFDLPKFAQEGYIEYCKERSYTEYVLSSYRSSISLKDDFLDYLELIYKDNYISPNDFEGDLINIEYEEINTL